MWNIYLNLVDLSFSWSAVDSTTTRISQILTLWTTPRVIQFSAVITFRALRWQLLIRWVYLLACLFLESILVCMLFRLFQNHIAYKNPKLLFVSQSIPGCFHALKKLVDDNAVIIIAVALGIAALEVLDALSFCQSLCSHFKSELCTFYKECLMSYWKCAKRYATFSSLSVITLEIKMVIMHFNRAKKLIKKSLSSCESNSFQRWRNLFKLLWRITKTSLFIITIRPETFIKQINRVSFDFLLTLKVSFICLKCTHPQLIQD